MMTINEMQRRAHETALKKGWWDTDKDSILSKLCLVHSEISEALEEYRESPALDLYHHGRKPCGFGIELADAVIRIADLCGHLGIDLEAMIETKMDYNDLRAYRQWWKQI